MATGKVKFFNAEKGFGFIVRDDGEPQSFCNFGTYRSLTGSMREASEYSGFRLLWRAKLADKPRPSRWQLHRVNPIAFPASKRARPFTVNGHHKHHKGAAVLTSLR